MLLENVKGLLSHERGKTVRKIYQTLDELGYDTQSSIINTKDFLPQNRERIFIVATLRGPGRREIFPLRESIERNNESRPKTQKKGKRIRDKVVGCIDANYHKGYGSRTMIVLHQSEHQEYRIYSDSGLSPTLGVGHAMNTPNIAVPVLTPDRIKKRQNGRRFKEDGDPSFTLTVQDQHGIFDGKRIRKLTPKECERLQGFDDEYTKGISNSQRYKCLGNAVTVPAVQHIMSKISITDELKCIDN
jgi:DNA (cytosine-5)-methyltransferase 1